MPRARRSRRRGFGRREGRRLGHDADANSLEQTFVQMGPNTSVALTPLGKERIATHWEQLDRLKYRSTAVPGG